MQRRLALFFVVVCFGPLGARSGESLIGSEQRACGKSWPWGEICSGRGVCRDGKCICEGPRRGETCQDVMLPLSETCPELPRRQFQPDRADNVRPDEIEIAMGMGDSLSLGMGLFSPWFMEHRGWALFTGCEADAVTLPNFVKAYNPNLIGCAMGTTPMGEMPGTHGKQCKEEHWHLCGLNAAVDGARVGWLMQEVDWLEMRLEKMLPGQWQDKWKMVTIFTGLDDVVFGSGNNKTHPVPTDVEILEKEFEAALDALHKRFPKLLVNVMSLPEKLDPEVPYLTLDCKLAIGSSKLAGLKWSDRSLWQKSIEEYNQMFVRVVARWQTKVCTYDSCPMVIALRFGIVNTFLGVHELDPLDCFHPKLRATEAVSINLWNEMLLGLWNGEVQWEERAICLKPEHRFTWPNPKISAPWVKATKAPEESNDTWLTYAVVAGTCLVFLLYCIAEGSVLRSALRWGQDLLIHVGILTCPRRTLMAEEDDVSHELVDDNPEESYFSGSEALEGRREKTRAEFLAHGCFANGQDSEEELEQQF